MKPEHHDLSARRGAGARDWMCAMGCLGLLVAVLVPVFRLVCVGCCGRADAGLESHEEERPAGQEAGSMEESPGIVARPPRPPLGVEVGRASLRFHELLGEAPEGVIEEPTARLLEETAALLGIADVVEAWEGASEGEVRRMACEATRVGGGYVDDMLGVYPREAGMGPRRYEYSRVLESPDLSRFVEVFEEHGIARDACMEGGLLAEALRFASTLRPMVGHLAEKAAEHRAAALHPLWGDGNGTAGNESEARRLEAEMEWTRYLLHKLFLGRMVHRHRVSPGTASALLVRFGGMDAGMAGAEDMYVPLRVAP